MYSEVTEKEKTEKLTSWSAISSSTYGAPLDFRELRHEPEQELEVIFLFGMVCRDLGFLVESIRSDRYPDCEAKRRIDKNKDTWERVKIEFEHRSGNFRQHAHDPDKCDLIICWIDDWEECPPELEVIELRSEIRKLPNS